MKKLLCILLLSASWITLSGRAYNVFVDGKPVEVIPFRDISYVHLEGDAARQVTISSDTPVESCEISPLVRHVPTSIEDGKAVFSLPSAGWWVARINETDRIFLLIDRDKESVPRKRILKATSFPSLQAALDAAAGSGKTLVVPPGEYVTGTLRIGSDTDVFFQKGAVVRAPDNPEEFPNDGGRTESKNDNGENMTFSRLVLIEGDNITLRGHGTLDGNGTTLRSLGKRANLIRIRKSSNVLIDGLVLRNSAAWNTHILYSDNVTVRNIKMINDPNVANTDGFDPDSSTGVLIENCFAYCSDDNVAVKTTNNSGLLKDVDDITVRGCVFLTRKSSLKVGTESRAASMRNIRFINNDVLECDRAFAIYCNDGARMSGILYENNRIERNWPDAQQKLIHFRISKRHGEGFIDGVTIRGCAAYRPFPRKSEIRDLDETHRISNLVFENCSGFDVEKSGYGLYDRDLKDVLDEVEKRFGVTLVYKENTVKGRVVKYAPWRFTTDAGQTLDNILVPLDLRKVDKGNGSYEVKPWEYFRKSDEDGAAQLDALWQKYGTAESWDGRREALRRNIVSVLGIDRFPRNAVRQICSGARNYEKYSVENIALEVLPGVWVCGSLYKPLKYKGTIPVMLCPHGHFYNKTDHSIPNERGRYRPDQQLRCATLAMMGCAVFSYDMWAWGESALAFNPKDHKSELGLIMQIWQSVRILDWICTRKWTDTGRIGVTGASGGGTQAMILTAIDDRITLSVPVVMTSSHFYGGCPCESSLPMHFIPGEQRSNNAEFAAMAAPRAQLVISDGNDWTSSVPQIEFPYLKKVYSLYGAESNIRNVHLAKEKHDYGPSKREAMYRFVSEQWGLPLAEETDCRVEPATQMQVFGGTLPEGSLTGTDKLKEMINQY